MKIRNGFVSNSSSSSFIVAFQKGLTKKDKRTVLYEKMGVTKDSFFFLAAKCIADCIIDAEPTNLAQYVEYLGYDNVEAFIAEDPTNEILVQDVFLNSNLDVFVGSATNEGYEMGEALFCDMHWYVSEKDFYIDKEDGF